MGEMEVFGNLMTNSMFRNSIFFLFCCFLLSCSTEPKQKTEVFSKVKIAVPDFNEDSAYYFVEKQVSFGPRVLSSKGWENCAIWLQKNLKRILQML